MKLVIITQGFYPDTVSVGQHAEDLALSLVNKGHDVTVYTSKFTYEKNEEIEKSEELYKGIRIKRIRNFGFSKTSILGRLINFASFNLILFFKLLFLSKKDFDLIIGMTLPPFVSLFGVILAKLKAKKFVYWIMDVQPGLAIELGMIKKGSLMAKFWQAIANFICKKSDSIIVLDRFMAKHLKDQGIRETKINIIPVWPVMSQLYEGERLKNPFRVKHGFGDKIVIMYSGNHALVHPVDDILNVAFNLRNDSRFLFVFVGGGIRTKDVKDFKTKHQLDNIIQLPFQPRDYIHISLSAADLHLVILGNGQVGHTHPNKLYGALFLAKPVIYIGPRPSHVSDILENLPGNISSGFGEVIPLEKQLLDFADMPDSHCETIGKSNRNYALKHFNATLLRSKMVDRIENC